MGVRPGAVASLVMRRPSPAFWSGKSVLLTGHTGFKGGWAALWLTRMGARVTGLPATRETTLTISAPVIVRSTLCSTGCQDNSSCQ